MTEYLSKEEVKQWRSSLEKITLEEFAARLGKSIAEEKSTNDIVDLVLKNNTTRKSYTSDNSQQISNIAQRAFEREKRLSHTPFSFQPPKADSPKPVVTESKIDTNVNIIPQKPIVEPVKTSDEEIRDEVNIVLKKSLTDREQLVFEHFLNNKNKPVFAKDLAKLLDLPRDYVYKYIKNLRAKIEGDCLQNAENGGFILSV